LSGAGRSFFKMLTHVDGELMMTVGSIPPCHGNLLIEWLQFLTTWRWTFARASDPRDRKVEVATSVMI
jgi:hypothetical protein